MKSAISTAAALTAALLLAVPVLAETPIETVKKSNAEVLAIYEKHESIDAETETRIYGIIDRVTDFPHIADAVTSRFCPKLTEEQCRRFGEVFIRLLRISSTKKLGRYRADRFDYLAEEVNGDEAVVRTVAHYEDEKITLDYHLAKSGDGWRITNYIVEDIDTIRNYRKQFTRLFAKKSFEQVIERLEDRISALESEAGG